MDKHGAMGELYSKKKDLELKDVVFSTHALESFKIFFGIFKKNLFFSLIEMILFHWMNGQWPYGVAALCIALLLHFLLHFVYTAYGHNTTSPTQFVF